VKDLFEILNSFPRGTEVTFTSTDYAFRMKVVFNSRQCQVEISNRIFSMASDPDQFIHEIVRNIKRQLCIQDYQPPRVKVYTLPVVYQGWELGYNTIRQGELFIMDEHDGKSATLIYECNKAGMYLRHESVSRKQAECRMRNHHETYSTLCPNDPNGTAAH